MTVAQPSIRRLFEQVRALEVEAAARPPRRRTRDRALVVVAAAAIGAAFAGTQHAAVAHRTAPHNSAPLQLLHPVAHLIDAPAERARPLVHVAPHRVIAAAPEHARIAQPVIAIARPEPAPATAAVSAPGAVPASRPVRVLRSVRVSRATPVPPKATPAPAAQPHAAAARPVAKPLHTAPEAPAARPVAKPLHTAPPAPVGIGPVAVASSDEPLPDPTPAP